MKDSAHYVSELAPLLSSWWVFIMQVLPLHFGEISKISNHHILKANTKYSFFMKISAFSSYLKICLFALARLLHEIGANCKNYIGVSVLFYFSFFAKWSGRQNSPQKSHPENLFGWPHVGGGYHMFSAYLLAISRDKTAQRTSDNKHDFQVMDAVIVLTGSSRFLATCCSKFV